MATAPRKFPRTCVHPDGQFTWAVHRPSVAARLLRRRHDPQVLGHLSDGTPWDNRANFPQNDIRRDDADWIYEIPNALPFKGTTYIGRTWADANAVDPLRIRLPHKPAISFQHAVADVLPTVQDRPDLALDLVDALPRPLKLALATTSSNSAELVRLAAGSCTLETNGANGGPTGLAYNTDASGRQRPAINDPELFDAVANNPHLPDAYKRVMVLRPGVQGDNPIVGDWRCPDKASHIYEYLRCNSYIPWGHYAANMADDAVRYDVRQLSDADMAGLRHLYYQRTYARLADLLDVKLPAERPPWPPDRLEALRRDICRALKQPAAARLAFGATLWGWNYGFDFAPSGYRLHASHQQIHQQFAMIPERVPAEGGPEGGLWQGFACGDMVAEFIADYQRRTGKAFFQCYLQAIRGNRRMDGRQDAESDLVVYEDAQVMLFVPKAQTSQWELALMPLAPVGNIVEADTQLRAGLDRAMALAMKTLARMGATMISVIEYSKRWTDPRAGQHLLYAFLPRLPQSPGAFSEAQLRWINGHFPEDFAAACRHHLAKLSAPS